MVDLIGILDRAHEDKGGVTSHKLGISTTSQPSWPASTLIRIAQITQSLRESQQPYRACNFSPAASLKSDWY